MLYYLFTYLDGLDFPGAGMFHYISFRSGLAIITSLIISMLYGKKLIRFLQKKQIGEEIRDLGLEGQYEKKGTPTMGGIIIIASIVIPTLLFAKLQNIYVILLLITTLWLGLIGFIDDYIKVFKKDKEGLKGRFKILGQVGLGLIVGIVLLTNDEVVVRQTYTINENNIKELVVKRDPCKTESYISEDVKSTATNVPFYKNNEFDYRKLVSFLPEGAKDTGVWIVFLLAVIFIVTAVSNGANMTDGLDGLATGTSAIIGGTLGILAYVSGSVIYSDYLNIMYIPNAGELVVFMSAFIGSTIGFLWYNSYPAQVFMGDTGSLTLGGIIAVLAIVIRKELLIPVLCGVFFIESLSVVLQVGWFKYTRKKTGVGKRIFKMAPLHHHYQKSGYPEPKIVTRFWIIGIILAVITIITLKMR